VTSLPICGSRAAGVFFFRKPPTPFTPPENTPASLQGHLAHPMPSSQHLHCPRLFPPPLRVVRVPEPLPLNPYPATSVFAVPGGYHFFCSGGFAGVGGLILSSCFFLCYSFPAPSFFGFCVVGDIDPLYSGAVFRFCGETSVFSPLLVAVSFRFNACTGRYFCGFPFIFFVPSLSTPHLM